MLSFFFNYMYIYNYCLIFKRFFYDFLTTIFFYYITLLYTEQGNIVKQ